MFAPVICKGCGQPLDEGSAFCKRCGRATGEHPAIGLEKTVVSPVKEEVLEGKWKLSSKLGEGGMGTVYLAHDIQLDREVAVKILAKQLAEDQELVQRFEREARMTAKLEHPNIVPVYAVGRFDGRPFIVMKKLEGQTLSQLLREKGALDVNETLNVVRQLAAGLDFIHQKGFVHRDIKASNIFISSSGNATILDFGILRSKQQEQLTRTGMVMGTPQYMSPEQALGIKDIDHRADLYAVAVLVYECLTGTLPFDGDNELSIIQMQAHLPPPDLLERAPWVPKPIAEVISKALAKRPEDRYQSAGELYKALDAARASAIFSGPLQSTPPPAKQKVSAPPTTPAIPSGIGAAAIQAQLAGKNGTPPRSAEAAPHRSDAGRSPSTASLARKLRTSRAPLAILAAAALVLTVGGYYALARSTPPAQTEEASTPTAAPTEPPKVATAEPPRVAVPEPAVADAGAVAVEETEPPTPDVKPAKTSATPHPKHGGNGKLNVVTTVHGEPYWASVWVDGIRQDRTTPLLLELAPGRHELRVERIGFHAIEKQVRVAAGRSQVVQLELQP